MALLPTLGVAGQTMAASGEIVIAVVKRVLTLTGRAESKRPHGFVHPPDL
jgi:hypothetical protein